MRKAGRMPRRIEVDEKRFREMWLAGTPVASISAELGLAADSCNRVRIRLGLLPRTPLTRARPSQPYRDPTPQEIAERSLAIRMSWSPEVEERRRVSKPVGYEFPVVREKDIDDAQGYGT